MNICPFCGRHLDTPVNDGLTSCLHCGRIIESKLSNRLLSLWWLLNRIKVLDIEQIKAQNNLKDEEIIFVLAFREADYSYDDFQVVLNNFNII